MALDVLALAVWLCVSSLELEHHSGCWGHREKRVSERDSGNQRWKRSQCPLGLEEERLETRATAGVALPIPGLLLPRLDLLPHTVGISDSLGHRNLYRSHESILKLGPRL